MRTYEYSTDLFTRPTIERLVDHFRVLLEGIAADPDRPIGELPLLTEDERQQILIQWNNTDTSYPKDQCIQQLFEAQAVRRPEAVVCGDQPLNYAELNARANRLAHYLIEQGVGADTLVALCLERSPKLVITLLGILKAGGAYVPLDPDHPQERLAFMLKDTQAPVLITQASLLATLPLHEATVLCLDNAVDALANYSDENPPVRSGPQNLAYINYTSGSTGRPKGVAIPHRGVNRLVFGANYVNLGEDKTLLHMASTAFDATTFELWGALLHGGRCVLYPERLPTPEGLKEIIMRHGVDVLWLTASFFNVVVDTDVNILRRVNQLLTGGEALSVPHIRKALRQLKSTQLINGYGPTESTTFTCCYRIPKILDDSLLSIPIGRPVSNTQVYILDAGLKPVPIGVVGKLYIGGDGLAHGYLNRPELTAEKFVPHPFNRTAGAVLYTTGDLARYLADGNIEFVGRSDDQVKIRGFRVEPGEIEATLNRHPQVQESLVTVREDEAADKRLVAYVASAQTAEEIVTPLRDHLRKRLPKYMVPAALVVLKDFPLTPNGKVDRQALPEPDRTQTAPDRKFQAPGDALEVQIAAIWERNLGVQTIGATDNFFDLGGHSLIALQVVSQIRKFTGKEIPVAALFKAPTVAQLAEIVRQDGWSSPFSLLIPFQPLSVKPPFFCIHGASGPLASHLGPEQPFYVGMPHGFYDQRIPGTVEEMAADYVKEIKALQPEGPYFIGGYSFGGMLAFEIVHQLKSKGQQIGALVLIDPTSKGHAPKKEAPRQLRENSFGSYVSRRRLNKPLNPQQLEYLAALEVRPGAFTSSHAG